MRLRLGIAHSNQPAQHGYSGVRSVGVFLSHLEKSTSWLNLIRKLFPVFQKVGRLVTEGHRRRVSKNTFSCGCNFTQPCISAYPVITDHPRLLMDYLEDFCNDDGFIFCHCQVSHFKSSVVILLMYSYWHE